MYLCLRDCYVGDRLYIKDVPYELPDKLEKSPKNFKLIGEPEPQVEPQKESVTEVVTEPKISEPKISCDVCGKECKTALGLLSHKKSHKS